MVHCDNNNNLSSFFFFKGYPDVVVQLTSSVPIITVIITEATNFSVPTSLFLHLY